MHRPSSVNRFQLEHGPKLEGLGFESDYGVVLTTAFLTSNTLLRGGITLPVAYCAYACPVVLQTGSEDPRSGWNEWYLPRRV